MKKVFVAICVIAFASLATAEVELSNLFSSHMVLQRNLPVPIFGTASPGEKVTVSFAGQTLKSTAGNDGKWMVKLNPLKTSKTGRDMIIKAANTITLSDVLVGEVWFCSGQSNMAGKFVASKGRSIAPEELSLDLSGILFSSKNGSWKPLSAETQNNCSCVAYYFGKKLYDDLDIPIGLIQRASSGTPIQSWMSKNTAEDIRKELNIPNHWGDPQNPDRAHKEYDTWIKPILPVAFRGVIWYQGERNAKTQTGWEYKNLLVRLIESWRKTWAEETGTALRKFPFYYVQVPAQAEGQEYPWLRDSMRRVLDITENTGMAIYYDYGPSLHPTNKKPAGERLALWALAKDYGQTNLVHCGPLLDTVTFNGNKATLTFKHIGSGLKNATGEKHLKFFELAEVDGEYVSANAEIIGNTVIVQSDKINAPAYVRYLFWKGKPNADFSLMNAEGIPASSFITDRFKPKRVTVPEISPKQLKEKEQRKQKRQENQRVRNKRAKAK